ncbi:MAG: polyprenyl synthetase family protein [Deltaproteobacteria bacterium]|nr:polyprenyl synthetase family protein [Deltaproteobacteria bacterium]
MPEPSPAPTATLSGASTPAQAQPSDTVAAFAQARSMVDLAVALVADEMRDVEQRLKVAMESPVGPIPQVGSHLLAAGGKRLRPLMAVLAARATEAPIQAAIAVGCAAELIHSATLFHDDVVDDGRVRRGRPAARMVYGNGIVVLVGDFCLARALAIVAETGKLPVIQSLAATVTEMAEGEVAQLERAGNADATVEAYYDVIDRKTGALIAWCSRVGNMLPTEQHEALDVYGRAVGRAFQIADDILDCAVDELTAGKSVGHDLVEGKMTLPVLLACDRDPTVLQVIRAHMTEHGVPAEATNKILRLVQQAGGVEAARERANALVKEALAALGVLPASPYRDALGALARLSVERVV